MHFLTDIIGPPLFRISTPEGHAGAVITSKGMAVCDPDAFDTGCPSREDGDPGERCVLYRGHIHIRLGPEGPPDPVFRINPVSRWVVILPFYDLPRETSTFFRHALPPDSRIPNFSVKILQSVPSIYKADRRRLCRLRDALRQAGLPSPVTLVPTGLHSRPLKIYPRLRLRALPLPGGEKLSAIIGNWSGAEEFVDFAPLKEAEPDACPQRPVSRMSGKPPHFSGRAAYPYVFPEIQGKKLHRCG